MSSAALLAEGANRGADALGPLGEAVGFALSLPLWVVAAKLYGLYDRDEEQVDRSRADELLGVFNLVTVGAWLVFASARLTGLANPKISRLVLFWAGASRARSRSHVRSRERCASGSAATARTP